MHARLIIHRVVTKQLIEPAHELLWSCLLQTSTLPLPGSVRRNTPFLHYFFQIQKTRSLLPRQARDKQKNG